MIGTDIAGRSSGLIGLGVIVIFIMGVGLVTVFGGTAIAFDNRITIVSIFAVSIAAIWLLYAGLNLRRAVLLAIIAIILSPGIQLSPGLPAVFADDFIIFAVGGLLLVSWASGQRLTVGGRLTRVPLLLLMFIPVTALSMLSGYLGFDIVPTKGGMFEFVKIAKYFLAFYIASQVKLKFGHLRIISLILIGAVTISASLGLAQAFDLPGAREFSRFFFSLANDPNTGELHRNMLSAIYTRAAGTIGNPNYFALVISSGILFAIPILLTRTVRGPMLAVMVVTVTIMTVALFASGSRTAITGLVVALVYLLATAIGRNEKPISAVARRSIRGIRLIVITAFVGIATILVILVLQQVSGTQGTVTDRMIRITNFDTQQRPIQARIENITAGLELATKSPILGFGPAEGSVNLLHYRLFDNELVFVLLRYGALGFILFGLFWLSAFRLAKSLERFEDLEIKVFGRAVTACVVLNVFAMLAASTFFDIRRMTLACLMLGLCTAVHSNFGPTRKEDEQTTARVRGLT